MNKIYMIISLITFCELSFSAPLHVLVDPGHGGSDHGATNSNIKESEITLAVSKQLIQLLKKDSQFKVSSTRTTNRTVSLFDRAEKTRNENADLLISIHVNSSTDPKAKGAEFYILNQLPPEKESLFLAYKENNKMDLASRVKNWPLGFVENYKSLDPNIQNILHDLTRVQLVKTSSLLAKTFTKNWKGLRKKKRHSIKQAPFYVISNVNIPAVLIELGFLTHP